MKPYLLLQIVLLIAGCSNKSIYETLQAAKFNHCSTLRQSQFDECIQGMSKSFNEYEAARKELIETESKRSSCVKFSNQSDKYDHDSGCPNTGATEE